MINLKAYRNVFGFSQKKLSEKSNVPYRTIQAIEAGGDCYISTAYKLSKALGITLNEFYTEEHPAE